jgi:hypothetical protein
MGRLGDGRHGDKAKGDMVMGRQGKFENLKMNS